MAGWLSYFGVGYLIYFVTSYFVVRILEKQRKFNATTSGDEVLKNIDLSDKAAIITGASAGLGKETTKTLVKKGCLVYMACRNVTKAEKAKKEIINALKNEKIKNINEKMIILKIDLSSLQSIQDFAKKVLKDGIKVDYLINNAGIMALPEYKETENGIEFQFGVNHIGHFYMTILLMPLLKENKTRIINLSSYGHKFADLNKTKKLFEYCINENVFMGNMKNIYTPFYNYALSKACNILFTRELNELFRKDGIYSIAVHPGTIITEIIRDAHPKDLVYFVIDYIFRPFMVALEAKTPNQGVATTVNGIRMSNSEIEQSLYCYYENCNPVEPKKYSAARFDTKELQKNLWKLSEKLIKKNGFSLEL